VSSSRAANAVDAPPTAGRRSRVRDVASGPAPTWTDREAAHGDRTGRAGGLGLLLATAVAGLSFSGTFAVSALLLPVLGVVAGVAAADQLTLGRPRVAALRAPLGVLLGATAGAAGLLLPGGVPLTGATLRALADGVLHGWLRTLESTLPAHPDLTLVAFVPALVLLAAVVGTEWLRRGVAAALTLLPSLAVVVLAQVFAAVGWLLAVGLAVVYGLGAAVVLAGRTRRFTDAARPALPLALVATLAGWVLAVVDPVGGPAWTVADRIAPITVTGGAVSPLAELAGRLDRPDDVVFTARADVPVTRWPLVVLDGYDGAGFTSSARYRPLGAELPPDATLTVPVRLGTADVAVADGLRGPWLPGQAAVRSVEGLRPAVDPASGSLLLPDGTAGAQYRLSWYAAMPGPEQLVDAAMDPEAAGTDVDGALPGAVTTAAAGALHGAPPSFATALVLERWFRDNYQLAGGDRPTGSGDVQLVRFLTDTKTGTSEQFAAAYVLMARAVGIPARLVVGFRPGPAGLDGRQVVRNGDAFAWPEVAVAGAGWVPLDPTGGVREVTGPAAPTDAATETARRRAVAPPAAPAAAPPPTVAAPPDDEPMPLPGPWDVVVPAAAGTLVGAVLLMLLGVPLVKRMRRIRRRRAGGSGAVVGAWLEVRDRLRDHGVEATTDMTVRDLRRPAAGMLNGSGAELESLARCVDEALWAGDAAAPSDPDLALRAWAAEKAIRGALAEQPLGARLRAATRYRGLTRVRDTRV
jgi:protein-glutamine gamma-glutamyltransferase